MRNSKIIRRKFLLIFRVEIEKSEFKKKDKISTYTCFKWKEGVKY